MLVRRPPKEDPNRAVARLDTGGEPWEVTLPLSARHALQELGNRPRLTLVHSALVLGGLLAVVRGIASLAHEVHDARHGPAPLDRRRWRLGYVTVGQHLRLRLVRAVAGEKRREEAVREEDQVGRRAEVGGEFEVVVEFASREAAHFHLASPEFVDRLLLVAHD